MFSRQPEVTRSQLDSANKASHKKLYSTHTEANFSQLWLSLQLLHSTKYRIQEFAFLTIVHHTITLHCWKFKCFFASASNKSVCPKSNIFLPLPMGVHPCRLSIPTKAQGDRCDLGPALVVPSLGSIWTILPVHRRTAPKYDLLTILHVNKWNTQKFGPAVRVSEVHRWYWITSHT
jgi:hypothetical protein